MHTDLCLPHTISNLLIILKNFCFVSMQEIFLIVKMLGSQIQLEHTSISHQLIAAPNDNVFSLEYFIIHRYKFSTVFLLILMSIMITWYFVAFEKKKNALKDEWSRQLNEYKLIALKAQVNPHFFANCLGSIQNLIMKNENAKAIYYVSLFGDLMRKVLTYSDKNMITLGEEMEITRLYVEMEQLRFNQKFEYQPVCDAGLDVHAVYVPPMILHPIVENAIWHGLLPLPQDALPKLRVEIGFDKKHLLMKICDNGVGRDFKESTSAKQKTSMGIYLTRQRLSNIHYKLQQNNSGLLYRDKLSPDGRINGTEVEILLPLILTPKNYENNPNFDSG